MSVCYSSHYHDKENCAFYENYGRYFKLTFSEDMNDQEARVAADVSVTVCDTVFSHSKIYKLLSV